MKRSLVVFGPGCARCVELARRVEAAARALGIDYELIKMSQTASFAAFGVAMTPALMVDERVVVQGRVPTVEELEQLLTGSHPT